LLGKLTIWAGVFTKSGFRTTSIARLSWRGLEILDLRISVFETEQSQP
jgi:hypothetical protein